MKANLFLIVKLILVIILTYLAMQYVIYPVLTSDRIQDFIVNVGPWGYLVLLVYTVTSHVFAPLSGSPAVFLVVTIYGIEFGLALLYLAGLISSTINFWISRKYGRNIVRKFVGEKAIIEIDNYSVLEGKETLIVARLLGFPFFDFVSYAAGLTNIPFKSYFLITATISIFTNLVLFFIFRNIDLQSSDGMTLWIVAIILSSIAFSYLFKNYLNKKSIANMEK